jgi:hypothetical protein
MGDFARRRAKASPTTLADLALAGGGTKRCVWAFFSVSASNREGLSVRVLWREPLQIVGKARRQEAVLGGEDGRASQA